MLRILVRFLGLLSLAGGFSALIVDGTRSIAANALHETPLADTIKWIAPSRYDLIKPAVQHIHPLLWDPVLVHVLTVPTWVVLSLLGLVLLYLGRPPLPQIGYSSRP